MFELTPTGDNQYEPTLLNDSANAELPWFAPEVSQRRAVDSDGLDETAVVFELDGGNTLLQTVEDINRKLR